MGESYGITNHQTQQDEPPDILLTNYKMLDYLLLRPQDQRLWRYNTRDVLQYLVLDELHTYDGAQGADVACLIRRLKERLEIERGDLCVVGTSATLDDREPAKDSTSKKSDGSMDAKETGSDRLARFASTLFEEDIHAEAVIGEDRVSVEEMVALEPKEVTLPNPIVCQPLDDEDALKYAIRQSSLWGGPEYSGPELTDYLMSKSEEKLSPQEKTTLKDVEVWAVQLGTWLKSLKLFKYLLIIFEKSESDNSGPLTWNVLVEMLAREELGFNEYSKANDRLSICASFFALVAQAREIRSGHAFPLVPTQVQIWIRELRRLGRLIHDKPVFSWLDEPTQEFPSLPVFHCSECGECGWVGLADLSTETQIGAKGVHGFQLDPDPTKIVTVQSSFC
jgi:DEAD/DEAH box helicase domain-containing protein